MKLLGLDIGGAWVGSALSDEIGLTCRPYKTVHINKFIPFLEDTLKKESIKVVVVGHPITMGGRKSEQTKEIEHIFETLKKKFCNVNDATIKWLLWDERLSTKRAAFLMQQHKKKTKISDEEKKEHSVAAAFILQNYIDSMAFRDSKT